MSRYAKYFQPGDLITPAGGWLIEASMRFNIDSSWFLGRRASFAMVVALDIKDDMLLVFIPEHARLACINGTGLNVINRPE